MEHVPEAEQLDGRQKQLASLRLVARAAPDYELLQRQRLASDALFVERRIPVVINHIRN